MTTSSQLYLYTDPVTGERVPADQLTAGWVRDEALRQEAVLSLAESRSVEYLENTAGPWNALLQVEDVQAIKQYATRYSQAHATKLERKSRVTSDALAACELKVTSLTTELEQLQITNSQVAAINSTSIVTIDSLRATNARLKSQLEHSSYASSFGDISEMNIEELTGVLHDFQSGKVPLFTTIGGDVVSDIVTTPASSNTSWELNPEWTAWYASEKAKHRIEVDLKVQNDSVNAVSSALNFSTAQKELIAENQAIGEAYAKEAVAYSTKYAKYLAKVAASQKIPITTEVVLDMITNTKSNQSNQDYLFSLYRARANAILAAGEDWSSLPTAKYIWNTGFLITGPGDYERMDMPELIYPTGLINFLDWISSDPDSLIKPWRGGALADPSLIDMMISFTKDPSSLTDEEVTFLFSRWDPSKPGFYAHDLVQSVLQDGVNAPDMALGLFGDAIGDIPNLYDNLTPKEKGQVQVLARRYAFSTAVTIILGVKYRRKLTAGVAAASGFSLRGAMISSHPKFIVPPRTPNLPIYKYVGLPTGTSAAAVKMAIQSGSAVRVTPPIQAPPRFVPETKTTSGSISGAIRPTPIQTIASGLGVFVHALLALLQRSIEAVPTPIVSPPNYGGGGGDVNSTTINNITNEGDTFMEGDQLMMAEWNFLERCLTNVSSVIDAGRPSDTLSPACQYILKLVVLAQAGTAGGVHNANLAS